MNKKESMKKESGQHIMYFRPNGEEACNAVLEGGYDDKTGELIFLEILGHSGDVRGG